MKTKRQTWTTPLTKDIWTRWHRLPIRLPLMALLLCAGTSAFAQLQSSGTIVGTVTDLHGNVVAHATVVLTSDGRGQTVTQTSNGQGEYLFQALEVGSYTLTVKAPSFGSFTTTSIGVDADQNVRVDAHLSLASVSETVVVDGGSTTVDTQSATIGVLIDPKLIEDMPIDGNNVVALAALLPGVTNVSAPTTFTSDTGGPSYNVNGARNTENLFLLDGAIWNNLYTNSGLNYPPAPALQEVSVLLNNFKAQYGRNVGSVFNAITRSGNNKFHGQFYDYVQNKAFNASDYISQRNPKLVQNQFGATIGGPILRNKLFFYLAYQDLRAAQTATAQATGLTLAQRGLTASGAANPCSATGAFAGQTCATDLGVVRNPLYTGYTSASSVNATTALNAAWTQAGGTGTSPCVTELLATLGAYGQYVPNDELPSVCFNPVSVKLIDYIPPPNLPNGLSGTQAASPKNDQNGLARIDYQLKHHSLDARFYATYVDDMLAKSVSLTGGVANYEVDHDLGAIRFGDISDTWVVSPTFLNVARAAYKRYVFDTLPTDPTTLATLGANFVSTTTMPVLPYVIDGALFTLGSSSHGYSHVVNEDVELVDTVSLTHGNHNLQAGVDYLRLQYEALSDQVPYVNFNSQYTTSYTGDLLLGLPQSLTVGNQVNRSGIQHVTYFYMQDDWRATNKLTLNLGLRYELPFQYLQPKGESETFVPGYQSLLYPGAPPNLAFVGDPGVRRSLIPTHYNNLAPRIGFNLDPFGKGKFSIRGGFGIFYSATNALIVGVGEPFHYSATYSQPAGGLSNLLLELNPVPANYNGKTANFTAPYTVFFPDKNFTAAYTEGFNLGVQQAIGKKNMLEIDYVGRLSRHQSVPLDLNDAIYDCSGAYYQANPATYCTGASTSAASYNARVRYPNFNYGGQGVVDYASIGTASYNGLQVLYTQRALKSLSVLTSFTYSRSLDDQSAGTTTSNSTPQPHNLRTQYGPSDFNSTLVFSLGWAAGPSKLVHGHPLVGAILNGWTNSGSYSAQSGKPYSVTLPGDTALTDEPNQRASQVPGISPIRPSSLHRADRVQEWFNTAAFTTPAKGTYSTLSRNSLIGPSYIVLNLGAGRVFAVPKTESARFNFRADAFNAFNTPNLSNPNAILATSACITNPTTSNCTTGKVLSTAGTNSSVGTNGRRLQLSLSLQY